MPILTKHSVLGFVCGVVCTLILEAGGAYLLISSMPSGADAVQTMEVPSMPPSTRLGNLEGTMTDLHGHKLNFADLRGKVVFLNLWATWCPPCRAELPSIDNLWKIFQGRDDIAILCVSEESADEIRAHPLPRTLTMPFHVFASAPPQELDAPALPTTFIFDREGRMIFGHTGMAQWDAPEVVNFLREQLAAQSGRRE